MEYAKKFILVPNDQISKHVPTEETLSELDREMSAILKNKRISDDEKVKLYMQVLQKRLNILDHNNVVQETISEALHTEEEEKQDLVEKSDLMEHLILESAPKNLKSNTRSILNYLKKVSRLNALDSQGRIDLQGKECQEFQRSRLDQIFADIFQ
ncbi:hypothetical protein AVEN_109086-1 [Araneus ventricosus]|uniref:Uncharacterized protein n=1 Tax=Araneus ventricosus TaxID=182803 RepID=A0A4Y2SDU3_ARAVE|nr:hypothetical protein AVEN_109086-1 [Araneus ventricosus]